MKDDFSFVVGFDLKNAHASRTALGAGTQVLTTTML
jgi:hypothetical protein